MATRSISSLHAPRQERNAHIQIEGTGLAPLWDRSGTGPALPKYNPITTDFHPDFHGSRGGNPARVPAGSGSGVLHDRPPTVPQPSPNRPPTVPHPARDCGPDRFGIVSRNDPEVQPVQQRRGVPARAAPAPQIGGSVPWIRPSALRPGGHLPRLGSISTLEPLYPTPIHLVPTPSASKPPRSRPTSPRRTLGGRSRDARGTRPAIVTCPYSPRVLSGNFAFPGARRASICA